MKVPNKTKVLVIEDDLTWSLFIESILIDSGYEIVGSASTVKQAQSMIEELHPDILICDIVLKDSSIFSIFSTETYRNFPIVFMSAHSDDQTYHSTLNLPKSYFLVKPFHKITLLSTLNLLISINPIHHKTESEKFIVVNGRQQQPKKITFDKIICINAEGNYSFIHTTNHIKYARKKSLSKLMEDLDERFIRVHKAYAINVDFIQRIDLGNRIIFMKENEIPIGRNYRGELDAILHQKN